jgi:hypothetical protein
MVALGELGEHRHDSQEHGSAFCVKAVADDVHAPAGVQDGGALGRRAASHTVEAHLDIAAEFAGTFSDVGADRRSRP